MKEWTVYDREMLYMAAKDFGFEIVAEHDNAVSLSIALREKLSGTPAGQRLGAGHVGDIADRAAARIFEVRS